MSTLSFERTNLQFIANQIAERDAAEAECIKKKLRRRAFQAEMVPVDTGLKELLFSHRDLIRRVACREVDRIDRVTEDFYNLTPDTNEDD